jgi:hypothetical protein
MSLARGHREEDNHLNDLQHLIRFSKAASVVVFCIINGIAMHLLVSWFADISHQALDFATGEPICPDLSLLEQSHQGIDTFTFNFSLLYLSLLTLSTLLLFYTHDKMDMYFDQQRAPQGFTPRR